MSSPMCCDKALPLNKRIKEYCLFAVYTTPWKPTEEVKRSQISPPSTFLWDRLGLGDNRFQPHQAVCPREKHMHRNTQTNIIFSNRVTIFNSWGQCKELAVLDSQLPTSCPHTLAHLFILHMTLGDKYYYACFWEKGTKPDLPKDTWLVWAELGFHPTVQPDKCSLSQGWTPGVTSTVRWAQNRMSIGHIIH